MERELDGLVAAGAPARERLPVMSDLAERRKDLGERDAAAAVLLQAIAIREREGLADEAAHATLVYRLGVEQWAAGKPLAAEQTLLQCREIAQRAAGAASLEYAACQHWLGGVWRETGKYAEAVKALQNAVEIREQRLGPRHPETAYALFTLAAVYAKLKDYSRAEAIYMRTLEIREQALGPCHAEVSDTLNNLGYAYRETGQSARAVPVYQRAIDIRAAWYGPAHPMVAQVTNNLGLALSDLGRDAEARRMLTDALQIRERALGPDHPRTVISIWNMVRSLRSSGDSAEAGPFLRRGLPSAIASGDPDLVWRFEDAIREHYQHARQPEAAIWFGKQAVNTIQAMRSNVAELDAELQRSFLAEKAGAYRALADLLIEQGRLAEGQRVLAMLKEEEFFDFIRRDGKDDPRSAKTQFSGAEQPWVRRYAEISGRVSEIGAQRHALEQKRRAGLSADDEAQLKRLEADGEVARRAVVAFMDALSTETAKLDAQRRAELARRDIEGLENYQDELKALGNGAVMLHYIVLPDKLRIVFTAPEVQAGRVVDIGAKELNRKVQAFRDVLQNPVLDPRPAGRELYDLLLGAVAADLAQANAQTLMVSLDGTLRYLPFAALFDGERYLVERYRIAVLTEAARNRLSAQPTADNRFAGLGLTRKVEGFDALPAVKDELEGILEGGSVTGEMYLDDAFTADRMKAALNARVPLIHVASHFKFSPGTEVDSFLLLGDGGRLSLRDLREAGYNFRGVDLLTLSACETAVGGGSDANGREVEGFGALAQQRGARAVMATLWPVADASTGLLMQQFYRLRADGRAISKAEALRQSQIGLLTGQHWQAAQAPAQRGTQRADANARKLFIPDPKMPYAHPFFWAPFILMGNWL